MQMAIMQQAAVAVPVNSTDLVILLAMWWYRSSAHCSKFYCLSPLLLDTGYGGNDYQGGGGGYGGGGYGGGGY